MRRLERRRRRWLGLERGGRRREGRRRRGLRRGLGRRSSRGFRGAIRAIVIRRRNLAPALRTNPREHVCLTPILTRSNASEGKQAAGGLVVAAKGMKFFGPAHGAEIRRVDAVRRYAGADQMPPSP